MNVPETVAASVYARERGGRELAARSPDVPLPPASNAKLLTTALALHHLGPEYRFETRVRTAGDDLVIAGRGNPSLTAARLSTLAERVRRSGVGSVSNVVADTGWFAGPARGPGWTWQDGRHAYGAGSTPLALDGNTVTVTVREEDGRFVARASPETDAVELAVDVEPRGNEEPDLRVFRDAPDDTVRVEGNLPPGESRTEDAPVGDPVRHCLLAFREALEGTGVSVGGELRGDEVPPAEAIATVESPPLSELVRATNVPSDNFLAEQIARTVARETRGEGSWEAWEAVVSDSLSDRDAGGFRIRDGSGLSRYNLVSARGMVRVLEWAAERPWGRTFFDSLPAPGEGTLSERLTDVGAEIRAKTGTLTGSRTLSGIVRREGKPDVTFSVLLGGLTGEDEENARETIDGIVRRLAG